MVFFLLLLANVCVFATDILDIRVLKVEFKYENTDNSLTTGRGTFSSDTKDYKLDPKEKRAHDAYWESHLKFAKNYFEKASYNNVEIRYDIYPKSENKEGTYKLDKFIIDYNRTSRKKGEKMEAFDSARAADYANFVNDVLELAKKDTEGNPLRPADYPAKRVVLIAHAGSSRLIDGGTMGIKGANTPGDFPDVYIDSTWCDKDLCIWRGFEVDKDKNDSVFSAIVTSETASQDGLNWGINGIIVSQIGRELGLPYSYDVVKGFSRLGYFDLMDFAGANAGNGFFPSLPSAWMRIHKDWGRAYIVKPVVGKPDTIEICAAGYDLCDSPQIVKVPINANEYILLENRQRAKENNKIRITMDKGVPIEIPVDSIQPYFLDSATQKAAGVVESIDWLDAALPASGIAAWRVNDWFVKEMLELNYGAVNAWQGNNLRDHQFGISLIEADGVLGLGKEFKNMSGESVFYFGSGSDLIPHKKFGGQKTHDTLFAINPTGYANTASTFGGYSGIKITALKPKDAVEEKTLNQFTGDSVVTWRALKIPVVIEWVGKYARPASEEECPIDEANFIEPRMSVDIDGDGYADSLYLGNNRLYVVDSNKIPLPNFPAILSNSEPFKLNSKPLALDITGNDTLDILVPTNNGLILAVNSKGRLLKDEFPLIAGVFEYDKPDAVKHDTLRLYTSNNPKCLYARHKNGTSAFFLPLAKAFQAKEPALQEQKDEISEFFVFPNPVRAGRAAIRFRTLAPAASATLEVFDITGFRVFHKNIPVVNHGSNQIEGLDFSKLGSDVYSAKLTVKFSKSGKNVVKWVRIAVVK